MGCRQRWGAQRTSQDQKIDGAIKLGTEEGRRLEYEPRSYEDASQRQWIKPIDTLFSKNLNLHLLRRLGRRRRPSGLFSYAGRMAIYRILSIIFRSFSFCPVSHLPFVFTFRWTFYSVSSLSRRRQASVVRHAALLIWYNEKNDV